MDSITAAGFRSLKPSRRQNACRLSGPPTDTAVSRPWCICRRWSRHADRLVLDPAERVIEQSVTLSAASHDWRSSSIAALAEWALEGAPRIAHADPRERRPATRIR